MYYIFILFLNFKKKYLKFVKLNGCYNQTQTGLISARGECCLYALTHASKDFINIFKKYLIATWWVQLINALKFKY